MAQDGLTGWKWKLRLAHYLAVYPGVLRQVVPAAFSFFLPGFHPWKHDDRHLIQRYDSEFIDAVMARPAEPVLAEPEPA
jgi:predicted metal-dependent hydrolase